jgi:hypothetical protein
MPLALIHRFTAKKLAYAFDNNYWYSGIVIRDSKSTSIAMVQADKEAKRIYVRIKGVAKLGMWEHIRREFDEITSSYAKIPYAELIALDERSEATVDYEDLISHIQANKPIFFHAKLQKDFNVGYLIGLFEKKQHTIEKFKSGEIPVSENNKDLKQIPPFVINILNNNSPTLNTHVNTQVNIDIDIQVVNDIASSIKGDADYLLESLGKTKSDLGEALKRVIQFADDAKTANNSGNVKEKGWGRKLKSIIQTLSKGGKQLKDIGDGGETLKSILLGIKELATHFNLQEIVETVKHVL